MRYGKLKAKKIPTFEEWLKRKYSKKNCNSKSRKSKTKSDQPDELKK